MKPSFSQANTLSGQYYETVAWERKLSTRARPTNLLSAVRSDCPEPWLGLVSPWEKDYCFCSQNIQGVSCQTALLTSPPLLIKLGGKSFPVNFSSSNSQSVYLGSKSATDRRRWGLELKCCSCARISWKWGLLIRSCDQQLFISS